MHEVHVVVPQDDGLLLVLLAELRRAIRSDFPWSDRLRSSVRYTDNVNLQLQGDSHDDELVCVLACGQLLDPLAIAFL